MNLQEKLFFRSILNLTEFMSGGKTNFKISLYDEEQRLVTFESAKIKNNQYPYDII